MYSMTAKCMKGTFAAMIMLAALAPTGVWAQDSQDISESHLKAAREAITAIQATDRFDEILPGTAEQLKTQLITNNPNLDQEITKIVEDETLKLIPRRADLEAEIARAYAAAFSEDELKAIAEFYHTEAGKKLLDTGPIVTREVNKSAEVWARGVERDLSQSVVDRMKKENLGVNTSNITPPVEGDSGSAPAPANGQ